MLRPTDRRALRRHACFDTPDDARGFVTAIGRCSRAGMAVAVLLDDRRQLLDLLAVPDAADRLPAIVRRAQRLGHRRSHFLALVSDRSGDPVPERPDDELTWAELAEQAEAVELVLLDWWILTGGGHAFSVAELTPSPTGW